MQKYFFLFLVTLGWTQSTLANFAPSPQENQHYQDFFQQFLSYVASAPSTPKGPQEFLLQRAQALSKDIHNISRDTLHHLAALIDMIPQGSRDIQGHNAAKRFYQIFSGYEKLAQERFENAEKNVFLRRLTHKFFTTLEKVHLKMNEQQS